MTKPDTDNLEAMFQDARATPPALPDGLMDRVLADAISLQQKSSPRGWRGLWHTFGGAPALGGLVAATAFGFWIGIAPPSSLPDIAAQIITGETIAAAQSEDTPELTAFGWDIDEG